MGFLRGSRCRLVGQPREECPHIRRAQRLQPLGAQKLGDLPIGPPVPSCVAFLGGGQAEQEPVHAPVGLTGSHRRGPPIRSLPGSVPGDVPRSSAAIIRSVTIRWMVSLTPPSPGQPRGCQWFRVRQPARRGARESREESPSSAAALTGSAPRRVPQRRNVAQVR
jgi:hypothetical protein